MHLIASHFILAISKIFYFSLANSTYRRVEHFFRNLAPNIDGVWTRKQSITLESKTQIANDATYFKIVKIFGCAQLLSLVGMLLDLLLWSWSWKFFKGFIFELMVNLAVISKTTSSLVNSHLDRYIVLLIISPIQKRIY